MRKGKRERAQANAQQIIRAALDYKIASNRLASEHDHAIKIASYIPLSGSKHCRVCVNVKGMSLAPGLRGIVGKRWSTI